MKAKSLFLALLTTTFLSACSDKNAFEQAVLAKMQDDTDIKDYKIDPERLTKCVVEGVSQNMPGIFIGDPARLQAYKSYTKMLTIKSSPDPQKTLAELRTEFGSAKGLADANRNFSEATLVCEMALTNETESKSEEKAPATPPAAAPSPAATAPAVEPTPSTPAVAAPPVAEPAPPAAQPNP